MCLWSIIFVLRCVEKPDPCNPSPCGPGTMCMTNQFGNAICRCLEGLVPKPDTITGCQPECEVIPNCSLIFGFPSQTHFSTNILFNPHTYLTLSFFNSSSCWNIAILNYKSKYFANKNVLHQFWGYARRSVWKTDLNLHKQECLKNWRDTFFQSCTYLGKHFFYTVGTA